MLALLAHLCQCNGDEKDENGLQRRLPPELAFSPWPPLPKSVFLRLLGTRRTLTVCCEVLCRLMKEIRFIIPMIMAGGKVSAAPRLSCGLVRPFSTHCEMVIDHLEIRKA